MVVAIQTSKTTGPSGDTVDPTELSVQPGAGDLASTLPESLTVNIELPVPVHEQPEDEAAVALDEVAITPALAGATVPATTSIQIITHVVHPEPVPADEAEDEPAEIPALPDADEPVIGRRERARLDAAIAELESEPQADQPGPFGPARDRRTPPEGFWQRGVYEGSLHLIKPGDSARARERKAIDARIARRLEGGTRSIPVLTRKGGVGKTTITTLLGMALADVREDRVVAVDANPDRGTLAERVNKQTRSTVRDLVSDAADIRDFSDLTDHVSRDATRLDVVASETDPLMSEAFDEDDYNVVADVLSRYYSIMLTDCGTGIVHSVMRATLQRADEVVIVSGGSVDEARLASETLTWLEANDYGHLVRNAVVAINTATQGTNLVKLEEIEAHFRSRVRDIVRIPYDPELAAGSVVRYAALRPFTRSSARELAALVMDGLPSRRAGVSAR
ncbi:MAG TPA: MinD/ParA family protein [Pseudolysinimonas sp.]|nr:MinD/ParA family protein [Pseudolysinimonas sp.]